MERIFKANDIYLSDVQEFIETELINQDFSMKTIFKINIAVEEIFVNIAHYSTSDNAIVELNFIDDTMILTFKDNGIPFNPLLNEDPDIHLDVDQRDAGGLGIYMVKQMMDEVSYDHVNEFNVLTMKKKRG